MKKSISILLFFTFALFQAGCACAQATDAPENPAFVEIGEAIPASERSLEAFYAPDTESLRLLLDKAGDDQPCTAGSSLRASALAGGLLLWLAENPAGQEAARQTALAWAAEKGPEARQKAGRKLHLLYEAAGRMKKEELEALLADAGFRIPAQCPGKEAFLALTEELSRALTPEIFKNQGEKVNISRGNHCGAGKSVL